MTWALFRKDLRLFRVPFITGLVILAGAYLVGAIVAFGVWRDGMRDTRMIHVPRADVATMRDLVPGAVVIRAVIPAALVGLGLTAFLAASFGGAAFAAERRDRSAEFMAMLPAPRWRIAASKLGAVLACLLVPCAIHLAVIFLSPRLAGPPQTTIWANFAPFAAALPYTFAMALMLFGIAWLLSAVLDSAALAAIASLAVTCLTASTVAGAVQRRLLDAGENVSMWDSGQAVWALINPDVFSPAVYPILETTRTVVALAGAAALLAGTVVYVRRVAP